MIPPESSGWQDICLLRNEYYSVGIRSKHWLGKRPIGCLSKSCAQIRRKDNITFLCYILYCTFNMHVTCRYFLTDIKNTNNYELCSSEIQVYVNVWGAHGTWGHYGPVYCQLSLGHDISAMSFCSSGCANARYRNSCWPESVHWPHY